MDSTLRGRTRSALDRLRRELLEERTELGYWTGQLSPSALSTATAISAMSAAILYSTDEAKGKPDELRPLIHRGMRTLRAEQNDDGGYGDTDRSHSNIATSYLVLAASELARKAVGPDETLETSQHERLAGYLQSAGGIDGLRKRYGTDKTFVVPILANMAIAGLVDWSEVSALPFEAAVFPQSMYRLLRMPVVSYAIPALVAIGQARHFLGPKAFPPLRWIRSASIRRTMNVLQRMQPESGGYLEATPLTSFVVMSLAATGRSDCEVAVRGIEFLRASVTSDDSWPIDTNLATWVTSLSIHALASDPDDDGDWCNDELVNWHLNCQHRDRHPFTGAEPGGWGWTDLSGAVPDCDDTPAAVIALAHARRHVSSDLKVEIDAANRAGIAWLEKLQNRDGGWPTFCRGWGKLPFDRSSTDLTAHALRAFQTVGVEQSNQLKSARRFLQNSQQSDGAWQPLWFGNQDLPGETNPIYGTARVLLAYSAGGISPASRDRATEYLLANQNSDGGWGGGPSVAKWITQEGIRSPEGLTSSVEETSLAVEALAQGLIDRELADQGLMDQRLVDEKELSVGKGVKSSAEACESGETETAKPSKISGGGNERSIAAIISGVEFLLESVRDGRHRVPWPIGFYFAKLWYHERLYPLIFATAALGKFLRATASDEDH